MTFSHSLPYPICHTLRPQTNYYHHFCQDKVPDHRCEPGGKCVHMSSIHMSSMPRHAIKPENSTEDSVLGSRRLTNSHGILPSFENSRLLVYARAVQDFYRPRVRETRSLQSHTRKGLTSRLQPPMKSLDTIHRIR